MAPASRAATKTITAPVSVPVIRDLLRLSPWVNSMDMRKLQEQLTALSYEPEPIDGLPGAKTTAVTVAFRRAAGLYPDCIASPKTEAALAVEMARMRASPRTVFVGHALTFGQ